MRSILRLFGANKSGRMVLSSLCLVTLLAFYFFVLGTSLHVEVYTFRSRVTYQNFFIFHLFTSNADSLVVLLMSIAWFFISVRPFNWKVLLMISFGCFSAVQLLGFNGVGLIGAILTLPIIALFIIIDRFLQYKILEYDKNLSYEYLAIGTIALASMGIVSILLFLVTGANPMPVEKYSYALFQELFSLLTPFIISVLVFSVPVKIVLNEFVKKLNIPKKIILSSGVEDRIATKRLITYLSLCIFLAIGIVILSHVSTKYAINNHIGVDSSSYAHWLGEMRNKTVDPIPFVFTQVNSGDRPLTLILLYLMSEGTNIDPFQLVEYSPLLFAPLLVIVTFLLTRQITLKDKISILAAFVSAISFQTIIGIYSGFYANWLGLILGYLYFTLIFKFLKKSTRLGLITLPVLSIGLLLAHIYTWSIMVSLAGVILLVLYVFNYYPRKRILILFLLLTPSVSVDIAKSLWMGSSTGLGADISLSRQGLGVSLFTDRFKTLADTVQSYYGGAYANIAILGLVIYWLIRSNTRELANVFILVFLSSALIPLFLGDWVLQSRVLYDIPFQIPAAIGLFYLWKENQKVLFTSVLLVAFYLSLHLVANLGYIPPSNPFSLIG